MKCIICNSRTDFYFKKNYSHELYKSFMQDIQCVEYFKCVDCGFTFSKTHFEMEASRWEKLNYDWHHYFETNIERNEINQPPYLQQAQMISILIKNQLIKNDSWIDYAAGYGTLSMVLDKYFRIYLPVWDAYVKSDDCKYIDKPPIRSCDVVVNSAYFEHILKRKDLDEVNDLVSDNGCLILHTVICENIPRDPDWFYLDPPVHSAFHTNQSMSILMKQWGYECSVYCPTGKCWILFKKDSKIINKVELINRETQSKYFHYKKGFMDYWKGF